ncbi:PRC-barrel domain-containing protein [Methylocella sp. CPCC 101449]|jgi:hypothetical protein|uniref:PRC-barrel domain-containing protein n=1 Tax=Methylocella sp. CPCC 101449 TaxID=2987531 RepID=UPI00289123B1|nr:PRC-barrel domain-containing protein [Methylocella sp. CPCC 101449]MDT2022116.1 PRC-barrel domain-containing protein [Methylocella sp. CPCC 101449]HEV2572225.1 PRC-barrel domain-containing protein [Beijerinckiaceae bacterium]
MSFRTSVLSLAFVTVASAALAQTAVVKSEFFSAQPTDVLSNNLIGLNINNQQKEKIGEIKDLILSDHQLRGYIVSVGGFLGLGERYVAVSPTSIQVTYIENDKKWQAVMNATKEELKSAPEFKYEGRWKR